MPTSDPDERCAFERPRRRAPPTVECERNSQRQKDDAQRHEGFDEQALCFALPAMKDPRQREVHRADGYSAVGQRERHAANERSLQTEGHRGHAEHQRSVDVTSKHRSLTKREQDRDGDVQHEEHDEEGLRRREELRLIAQHSPGRADHEGEQETHYVERAPGLEPRDAENREVEHAVVAEEHDVIALPARGHDRRQKSEAHGEQTERE